MWVEMALSSGLVWEGYDGKKKGDAKTCFSAGQGRHSSFQEHSPGGAMGARVLLVLQITLEFPLLLSKRKAAEKKCVY